MRVFYGIGATDNYDVTDRIVAKCNFEIVLPAGDEARAKFFQCDPYIGTVKKVFVSAEDIDNEIVEYDGRKLWNVSNRIVDRFDGNIFTIKDRNSFRADQFQMVVLKNNMCVECQGMSTECLESETTDVEPLLNFYIGVDSCEHFACPQCVHNVHNSMCTCVEKKVANVCTECHFSTNQIDYKALRVGDYVLFAYLCHDGHCTNTIDILLNGNNVKTICLNECPEPVARIF